MNARTSMAMLGVAAAVSGAGGQIVGGENLREFWEGASGRRVDAVLIGDSTALFGGHGWDEGWAQTLESRFGLFASGVHSAGENQGAGAGMGWGVSTVATQGGGGFSYLGAPAELETTCNPRLVPHGYLYIPEGGVVRAGINSGLAVSEASPLNTSAALRFHYQYGLFSADAPGVFVPALRVNVEPYNTLTVGYAQTTGGGPGIRTQTLELPTGKERLPVGMRWSDAHGPPIRGPFFASWMRVERPDRERGAAVSVLYGAGGRSARDAAEDLLAVNTVTFVAHFRMLRSMQAGPGLVLFRLGFGVNDRSEDRASVGPGRHLPGNSAEAFEENVRVIIDRVEGVWHAMGWDTREVFFVLSVSPPLTTPDDELLVSYRDATDRIAASRARTASVRFDSLTSEAMMTERAWYASAEDHYHFSPEGFAGLSQLEVEALIGAAIPPCYADFNRDGSIDGSDVEPFFTAWEGGDSAADVDRNGGVDGEDVRTFFLAWEAGRCP